MLLVSFFTSHLGKPASIPCSACFGKGSQIMAGILWKVNGSKVQNFGEPRIHEDREQNQRYFYTEVKTSPPPPTQFATAKQALKVTGCLLSSSNELTCLSTVLKIEPVREEDLSMEYDCVALNLHGWTRHTIRLKRRSPSKECF